MISRRTSRASRRRSASPASSAAATAAVATATFSSVSSSALRVFSKDPKGSALEVGTVRSPPRMVSDIIA